MKKFIFKLIGPILKRALYTPKFREYILREINKKVDIPRLSEVEEARLFETIYFSILAFLDIK